MLKARRVVTHEIYLSNNIYYTKPKIKAYRMILLRLIDPIIQLNN